jgi:hypothetical protein
MEIFERLNCSLRWQSRVIIDGKSYVKASDAKLMYDEIVKLRGVLQQITELSPFKFNTGHASLQYITQMLVEMTALAHEALKEKE